MLHVLRGIWITTQTTDIMGINKMKELRYILKMVQVVQSECLGTEITISVFNNQKYFAVHVQRSDLDYEVIYSDKFFSTDIQGINIKKFAALYAFVVDEACRIGYTLTGDEFTKVETAVKQAS